MADYVQSLQVRNDQFDDFDKYALDYMRRYQERPEYRGNRDFRQALFGSHVFGHLSEIPKDRRPGRDATNRWITANITPARAILAIAGDIDPEEGLRSAERAFGGWSGAPGDADPEPLGTGGTHAEIITHRAGATQAVIRLGCRLPKMDWADQVRAEVASLALSQRIGSVREGRGLSYGLSAWVEMLRGGTGVLHVGGAVENAGLASALRTIRNELVRLATLKGAELDRGRWALASSYNLDLATTSDWVTRVLDAGKYGWNLQSIDNVPDVLATLDAGDVLFALKSCTTEGVLSIVGDETIARRAINEAWLPTTPARRGTLSRP